MPMWLQTLTICTQFNFTVGNVPMTFDLTFNGTAVHSIPFQHTKERKETKRKTSDVNGKEMQRSKPAFLLSTIKVILTKCQRWVGITLLVKDCPKRVTQWDYIG